MKKMLSSVPVASRHLIEHEDLELGETQYPEKGYSIQSAGINNRNSPYHRARFSLKVMNATKANESNYSNMADIESFIFKFCDSHPFIYSMYSQFNDKNNGTVALLLDEFVPKTLETELEMCRRLPLNLTVCYISEIISVLSWLQRFGIAYRDLRPECIHLSPTGHIKMVHFNEAKRLNISHNKKENECKSMENDSLKLKHDRCSFPYASRALGCLIYRCLVGTSPFRGITRQQILKSMKDAPSNLKFPNYVTKECRDIICELLQPKVENRLGYKGGFAEIANHAFFSKIDWDWIAMSSVDIKALWNDSFQTTIAEVRPHRSRTRNEALHTMNVNLIPTANVWCNLLDTNENVCLVSDATIETWSYLRRRSDDGTLIFTDNRRLLFICNGMIDWNVAQSKIVSITISNDDSFILKTVKKSYTIKVIETTSEQWRNMLQSWQQ